MERWKINRIGMVNFWYYDDECFEFEDGKLLLRGQNGSGKSITTQSFIPFILDGDRSASRLDPFGTKERKMEYYFLLDDAKDESTGYLYMEFYKEETKEYRTIGIGQRYKKGSNSQNFWGFIILDNRRIGVDFKLYRQSGGKNIPFDKNELRKILGEENILVEENRRYKELVNKYLFGFERIDQYNQFVNLLIQVRAPKLSNNFSPNKLVEILKNSLQVLADEDLRAMVEAMEKMDEIEERLNEFKRAQSASKAINDVYEKYNKAILNRKYLNFKNKENTFLKTKKDYDIFCKEYDNKLEELSLVEKELYSLTVKQNEIKDKIEQLLDPELENIDSKLSNKKSDLSECTSQKEIKEEQYQNKQADKRFKASKLNELTNEIAVIEENVNNAVKSLNNHNSVLKLDFAQEINDFILKTDDESGDLLESKIKELKYSLIEAQDILSELETAKNDLQKVQEEFDEIKNSINEKYDELDSIDLKTRDKKDELINIVDGLKNNNYWNVAPNIREEAINYISSYKEKDFYKFENIFLSDYKEQTDVKNSLRSSLSGKLKLKEEELKEKQEEYDEIAVLNDVEPKRDKRVEEARILLKNENIDVLPFYKTIKFKDGILEERKVAIEEALFKSGLLDALVVPKDSLSKIQAKYKELNDIVIFAEECYDEISFSDLQVEDGLSKEMAEEVKRILSQFGHLFKFDEDNHFNHGLLKGHVLKDKSEYIGTLSRKLKKEELLRNKQIEIEKVKTEIESIKVDIKECDSYIYYLNEEYKKLPRLDALEELVLETKNINQAIKELSTKQDVLYQKINILTLKKDNLHNKAIDKCKSLNYGFSLEKIMEISAELDEYHDEFNRVIRIKKDLYYKKEKALDTSLSLEDINSDIDGIYLEIEKLNEKIVSINQSIKMLEELSDNPEVKQKIEQISSLRIEEDYLEKEKRMKDKKKMELEIYINNSKNNRASLEQMFEADKLEMEKHQAYFIEEANLNFVLNNEEDIYKQAEKLTKESKVIEPTVGFEKRIQDVFTKYSGDLINYQAAIEEKFVDEKDIDRLRYRLVIVAYYNGQKQDLSNFYDSISNNIEEIEEIIKTKDRELFEDILSQTISQKLTRKIDESRNFIKEMSALMKKLKTSMGLNFSLDFSPIQNDDGSLSIKELERILTTDKALISSDDEMAVARYFRNRIQEKKKEAIEKGEIINYLDLVKEVLDYREWFSLKIKYQRSGGNRNDLTNGVFNKFSGGEKAMAMYIPLFASVNAQLKKATELDHPRLIALDEAFAGIDETNIESLFKLVDDLDFDYIMNSQVLWGCYKSVGNLRIIELLRPNNSTIVSAINYVWNGKEKRLLS